MIKLSKAKKQDNPQEMTPQSFIGLERIMDGYAEFIDGTILVAIEVAPVNVDLMTEDEQERFALAQARALTSQSQPFQIFSIGRSADLQNYHNQLSDAAMTSDITRRKILNQLMVEAKRITISGDVMERHHFIIIRQRPGNSAQQQIMERAQILANRLTEAGTPAHIFSREELVSLFMLFADPAADAQAFQAENESYLFA